MMMIKTDPEVEKKFSNYPVHVREQMLNLRSIVLESAQEIAVISEIEETLKWGEPSYLVKKGSTVRMDWKEKSPNQIALYFKCTSKLVESFKSIFGKQFNYEGNRAIVFQLNEDIPRQPLKRCIKAALTYHRIKHLENLGMQTT